MKVHSIRCEAVRVDTASGICVGLAKTKQGEVTILDGRTPEGSGICANAFCALSNAAFDDMPGEKDGAMERVCPHGVVTYRLSRSPVTKNSPYDAT